MPSLNLDIGYFSHRKTKRLMVLLGPGAELYPIKLWSYCAVHHPRDGVLKGYSDSEVESAIDWTGEAGKCVSALEVAGFITRTKRRGKDMKHAAHVREEIETARNSRENGWKVHDWKSHQKHLAWNKERAAIAAKARWDKEKRENHRPQKGDATSNATSNAKNDSSMTPLHCISLQPNPCISTQPNPTHINPTHTGEGSGGDAPRAGGEGTNGRAKPGTIIGGIRLAGSPKIEAELAKLRESSNGDLAEPLRKSAVTSRLAEIGVKPQVITKLANRRDVTTERIDREIEDIRKSGNASDEAAVLVRRLNPPRGAPARV